MNFFKKKNKAPRQDWKPHWTLRLLRWLWTTAFGALKVALGAVATVAINGAVNAALLAISILAVEEPALADKLDAARKAGAEKVLAADAEVAARFNSAKRSNL